LKAAKVIGRVVATIKYPTVIGKKILLLEPLEWEEACESMKEAGKLPGDDPEIKKRSIIALDAVGAGAGEYVFYVSSKEACQAFDDGAVCHNAVIGIVDGINMESNNKSGKIVKGRPGSKN
jgi:microcompartment protein CcmK/EutM